jgi:pimeloyl-ACP methyl ester carboxylesterase
MERDGIRLAFEEAGSGEPPLLLVHGWACDHTCLAPQFEHFARRHRVLTVDLRGHGASGAPLQDYTMAGFAEDLVWLCCRLDLRRPVVIGHSMGGVIALEILRPRPRLIAAIVALDSPMIMPPRTIDRLRTATAPLAGADFQAAARGFMNGMFLPTDDAARKARIVKAMSARPRHVLASAFQELLACPSAAAATASPVPIPLLAIASAGGHMADLHRLRELCPRLFLAQTACAGHFHQLEVPDQVNAMVERFIALVPLAVGRRAFRLADERQRDQS